MNREYRYCLEWKHPKTGNTMYDRYLTENIATIRYDELTAAGIEVKTYIGDIFGKLKNWKPNETRR